MSAFGATSINGVKIYNLASGKTFPQWMSEKKKRALAKDQEYMRRVELVQDFEFSTASQCIKMSRDGNYIVATGTYPPTVKVYDVRDLSIKFERRLDCEVVQFEVLSDDFGKIVFLQADRTITFHAPYGFHHAIRIPKFGRDMTYHRGDCDLYLAASSSSVYRVNLDQGRFMASIETRCPGVNVVKQNPVHSLLGCGGDDGIVECFDTRSHTRVGSLDVLSALSRNGISNSQTCEVTALQFDTDGLTFAVGTSTGHCMLFDLRSSQPLLTKQHQYGLPVFGVKFHDSSKKVISCDAKIMKIWDKTSGDIFTNIETPAKINDICVVRGGQGDSGVILAAGEQQRVMSYYVPDLGIAPKWCSFLDSITEELEETAQTSVYDDYKFITKEELVSLGLEHLLGTPLLKAYMHGFFMDSRLYTKVKAVSEPFAYEKYRKEKIQKKLEEKQTNRITIQKKLPKINQDMAKRILQRKTKKGTPEEGAEGDDEQASSDALFKNPLGDDRFSQMFTSHDFEIDHESETFKLLNPSTVVRKKEDMDSDSERDEADEVGTDVDDRFDLIESEEEKEGKGSDESSSSDDEELEKDEALNSIENRPSRSSRQPKLYELSGASTVNNPVCLGRQVNEAERKLKRKERKMPLSERMQHVQQKDSERSHVTKSKEGQLMREMSYVPREERLAAAKAKQDSQSRRRLKRGIQDLALKNPSNQRNYQRRR